jgi:predicted alpha/beta-fold hydrolase
VTAQEYRPPWWYRGRHLQTIWGPLVRQFNRPRLRRERRDTPDGDFVDVDWLEPAPAGAPLVLILHGLEGS